jgi:hypothetical protein
VAEVEADIQPKAQSQRIERRVAAVAARQHGVVARRQLRAIGLGDGAIRHRLALRRLNPVFRGVYAVGHPRLTGRGRWMAAVLSCGNDAVLSHGSAAALWGVLPAAGSRIHVTAPSSARRTRSGVNVHGGQLRPEDRAVHEEIPVTSVARTLLDLAEVVRTDRLERALEQAERLEILDLNAIERVCEWGRGRHGLKALVALLSKLSPAPHTRSELERLFAVFCREHSLPPPSINVLAAGLEVDAMWPGRRLVVELDGFEFHRTRGAFERDRARDIELKLAGYDVLRVTARRLEREPAAIAGAIRRLLARR